MKRSVINALLFAIAITATAQTSRRESSQSREVNNKNNNTTVVKSNNERNSQSRSVYRRDHENSNKTVNMNERSAQRNSDVKRVTETKNVNKTQGTTYRQPATVEHRSGQIYHSDRVYVTPRTNTRTVYYRNNDHHNHRYHATHVYVERTPARNNVVWDVHMHREYCNIYPFVKVWRIREGTPIYSISSNEAYRYVGDVKRVYGYVQEVYYDVISDEYHLYIGDYYPFQDFTVIVPGYVARELSRRPERYFEREYIWTTGYITEYDRRPEMLIKRSYQIGVY